MTDKKYGVSTTFGRYQLHEELGRGGMGVVYKAYDTQLRCIVALKVILGNNREDLERFFREITTVAKLNHPNIVRFYEYGYTPRPYFTMEYVEGTTLTQQIKERNVSEAYLVEVMISVCQALHYMHKNKITHRDIKPSNIMVGKNGVKVMDFGLARRSDVTKQLSKSGQMLGTLHYMAPEQVEGHTDMKSDIYALGASLYECLTYRPVYQGALEINVIYQITNSTPIPPRQLNPDISVYLEAICLKCLQRNPHKRYGNFLQLAKEFENFKAHKPILAKRYTSWDLLKNILYKHKVVCSSIVIIFVILLGSLVVTMNALNYAEGEKEKAKSALNKVMKVLDHSLQHHKSLQKDKRFAQLFTNIFEDVERYGENEDWSFVKAYVTQMTGQKQKSIAYYTKEIKNNTENVEAYSNRAGLYARNKEYQKAFADYEKALAIQPKNHSIYFNRAVLYIDTQEYQKATDDLQKVLDLAPNNERAYTNLGVVYFDLKKYLQAMACYDKAIDIAPRADTHLNRGLLNVQMRQPEKALDDFNAAIRLKPNYANAYFNRGNLFFRDKKWNLALTDYTKALSLDSNNALLYYNRGSLYAQTKQVDLALDDFAKSIQINPRYAPVYNRRAYIYAYEKKDLKKAFSDFTKAINLDRQFFEAYKNRGLLYFRHKKYSEAISDFKKATSLHPGDWWPYYGLHLCYQQLQDLPLANEYLQKAHALRK
ncbi:serine/threonine-protein kinase [Candidatus Uabimicrobium amorphum]|uniref:Serine/threonine protein kinase n=1 Tax=Uabimicrobium amorphum TaxID=2596890 RepID=A0A5S9INV0_UABAM|nr:serine/threonine-protein kinase [Candidatus Uabimicrobium amorphum]BBM85343.1 serine/threonine protein kinase [Candidatus Uabimicrobium amorphum]